MSDAAHDSVARRFVAPTILLILASVAAQTPSAAPAAKAKAKAKEAPAQALAPVFYPQPPDPPRFQFLGTAGGLDAFRRKESVGSRLLGERQEALDIQRAYGVAMRAGRLYVCDSGAGRGLVFDAVKRETRSFDVNHPSLGLATPINIAFGPDGRMYVTEPQGSKIVIFGPDEKPLAVIRPGSVTALGPGYEDRASSETCVIPDMDPSGIAVLGNEIFVGDLKSGTVQVLDAATGCRLREIGTKGDGDGQFTAPANLAIDSQGYLYVADLVTARVQKIDRNGKFVRTIGSLGRNPGQFVRPRGLAVDSAGRLFVADAATERVQLFDADGRLLMWVGQPGNDRGGLNLPAGIAIADDPESVQYAAQLAAPGFKVEYLLLVANQMGPNKVNLYAFGQREAAGAP